MRHLISHSVFHICAAAAALVYIWQISLTPMRTTGLQFVGPLALVVALHLVFRLLRGSGLPGLSITVYRDAAITTAGLAVAIFLGAVFGPKPAQAQTNDVITTILGTVFCVAVIAVICAAIAFLIWLVFRIFRAILWPADKSDGPDTRLFDLSALIIGGVILGAATLEGVPGAYAFPTDARATASAETRASPDTVWQALETATSPDVPLPDILSLFPRPVAVTIDEGTELGADRRVVFAGREGRGALDLTVTSRTPAVVILTVQSDTSPFADWVAFKHLTYIVTTERDMTRITVALDYDRRLVPAWFFDPVVKAAASQAMSVLANDVAARAAAL